MAVKFADYIKNHEWTFKIECEHADIRLCDPTMEKIQAWKEFPQNKNFTELSRYIQFMYQKNSPLVPKFRDVKKRREVAIEESGLKGKIAECVLLMTDVSDSDKDPYKFSMVVDMILGFLMFQNDKLWTRICIHESLFLEYSKILMTGIKTVNSDKDLVAATNAKKVTRSEFNDVGIELEALYEKFFNGDKEIVEKIKEDYRFTPENISRKIS
jgi:hypothetical protein